MGVVVDRARQHEAAGRVEHLGVDAVEAADARDLLAVDQDIRETVSTAVTIVPPRMIFLMDSLPLHPAATRSIAALAVSA